MASNQNQRNFFLAVFLSLVVLLTWSYLFPPPKPNQDANANTQIANTPPANETPETAPTQQVPVLQAQTSDDTQNRTITIKTPLYEAKFDSRGAVATSWILLENKTPKGEKPLYSAASTKDNKQPLQLIPEEGLKRRELPFKLVTGDTNLDALVNDRNYQINGVEGEQIVLNGNESRKIDFVLRDEATQTEVVKSLTFHADSYVSDLQTRVTRNGQPVPNAKLQIGASIGDQGIGHYTYYAIEP